MTSPPKAASSELDRAVAELIELVRTSADSAWANTSALKLCRRLERIAARLDRRFTLARLELRWMLIATNDLQELAIDNGWSERFLELAKTIEDRLSLGPA